MIQAIQSNEKPFPHIIPIHLQTEFEGEKRRLHFLLQNTAVLSGAYGVVYLRADSTILRSGLKVCTCNVVLAFYYCIVEDGCT